MSYLSKQTGDPMHSIQGSWPPFVMHDAHVYLTEQNLKTFNIKMSDMKDSLYEISVLIYEDFPVTNIPSIDDLTPLNFD